MHSSQDKEISSTKSYKWRKLHIASQVDPTLTRLTDATDARWTARKQEPEMEAHFIQHPLYPGI